MSISILDTEGFVNNGNNCAEFGLIRNKSRDGLGAWQMKELLDVYYEVSESYITFFNENWFRDNLEETNRRMRKDLQANMNPSFNSDCFQSLEQAKDTAVYVLALPFPADVETMKNFFREVLTGRLNFRCRYKIGDSNALDLIKDLNIKL